MAFDFNAWKKKAADLVQTGADKAKELSEIGKLKMQNADEQSTIRKAYIEMGKLYYAEHASAPEGAYVELCQKVTDAKAKIAYNNERIADIKAAGNLSDDEAPMDIDDVEPTAPAAPVEAPEVPETPEDDTPAE